jgi:protein AroM
MSKARIGMVTVGQAPRGDIVPDMAALLPGVDILEAGALDGLDRAAIARLAPAGDDEILVTRLADASSVFVGKSHVLPRVKARVAALEDQGVALTVLLCTGAFPRIAARRPLLEPQHVLLGVLRGLSYPGRLGVLTPSERHVPQTMARWRADGFEAAVVPLSPYEEHDPASLARATAALRAAEAGLVVMDCIGFRDVTRRDLAARLGVPVLVANLLVARLAAELLALS